MKSKILLVSSDHETWTWASRILSERGHEVVEAYNGEEGLMLARQEMPDLIVADMDLPRMDGLELRRRLLSDPLVASLPVILILSREGVSDHLEVLPTLVEDFLIRPPLVASEFVLRVERALTEGTREGGGKKDIQGTLLKLTHRELSRAYAELQHVTVDIIKSLATALEARDTYTRGHSERVGQYAAALGRGLGWKGHEVDDIETAGVLHDIGKIGISDRILLKPKKLTPAEFEIMKGHPRMSAEILAPLPSLQHLVPAIRCHHEFFRGGGYPDGLAGEAIPLGSRVLLIADAYEAMTSDRPYRKGPGHAWALDQLTRYAGTQFDPALVEVFVKVSSHLSPALREPGGGQRERAGIPYPKQTEI